jgi:hypothetical protein
MSTSEKEAPQPSHEKLKELLLSQGDKTKPDPNIRTGQGNPASRHYGELLSEEDEKRIDADDRIVVDEKLWGQASTGMYLSLYGTRDEAPVQCDRIMSGQSLWLGNTLLTVSVTLGKPKWDKEGFGLALEVPDDLGRDPSKQDYVTQWVIETTKEIFTGCETVLPAGTENTLAIWLVDTVDKHIRAQGL